MKDKLHWREVQKIKAIIDEEFALTPAQRALKRLVDQGFCAHDLWLFNKTKTAQPIPDYQKNNIYNDFRDFEIGLDIH